MKVEKFAEKVVKQAAEEKLTVAELRKALYIAKRIANNSTIEKDSIKSGGGDFDMDSSIGR